VTDRSIVWFDELGADDIALVGGKGANLGELTAAGLPVPPGFVVTAPAYLEAMDRGGVRDGVRDLLTGLDPDDEAGVREAAATARELVRKAGSPEKLRVAVLDAYDHLGADQRVAVRSSATAEDTADTSFARMHETLSVRPARRA
jgi:pyruvate,water dikinase